MNAFNSVLDEMECSGDPRRGERCTSVLSWAALSNDSDGLFQMRNAINLLVEGF
jgi:hypothetical protein